MTNANEHLNKKTPPRDIGILLEEMRLHRGMSKGGLSRKAGMHINTVRSLINGEGDGRIFTLKAVLTVLHKAEPLTPDEKTIVLGFLGIKD